MKEYFAYVFPVLLTAWVLMAAMARIRISTLQVHTQTVIVLGSSFFISFFPVRGMFLSQLILSVNPVFSIGSLLLLSIVLWGGLAGKKMLGDRDIIIFFVWNTVVSLLLYLSYLNFVEFDLYPMGYGSPVLLSVVWLLTIILIILKTPVAWIFLSYIAAYDLRLLPSDNFFDYITDGVLFTISMVILISYIVKSIVRKQAIQP